MFSYSKEVAADIIAKVTSRQESAARSRYSYIIVGKPGCGKTTLASKLASLTATRLVTPTSEFEGISNDLSDPLHAQVLLL